MELIGKVKLIMDEKAFSSGFTKREFVITTEEQYPQEIVFELAKEKGQLINSYSPGDRIKVFFDVRGREWQGKYFVNLAAWKLEAISTQTGGAPASNEQSAPQPPVSLTEPADDDLPF
jgi:hypothetical protein